MLGKTRDIKTYKRGNMSGTLVLHKGVSKVTNGDKSNVQYFGEEGEVGEVGENLGDDGENCAGATGKGGISKCYYHRKLWYSQAKIGRRHNNKLV